MLHDKTHAQHYANKMFWSPSTEKKEKRKNVVHQTDMLNSKSHVIILVMANKKQTKHCQKRREHYWDRQELEITTTTQLLQHQR